MPLGARHSIVTSRLYLSLGERGCPAVVERGCLVYIAPGSFQWTILEHVVDGVLNGRELRFAITGWATKWFAWVVVVGSRSVHVNAQVEPWGVCQSIDACSVS